jgi:hypothetical protein
MNYSDTLAMFDDGRVADARRAAYAKGAAAAALRALKCATHGVQALYVIVVFADGGHVGVHVKGCCDAMTAEAQRVLDAEVNPADAKWRGA